MLNDACGDGMVARAVLDMLVVAGEIDAVTCGAFQAALVSDGIRRVDLSAVTFFDSSALRALLVARERRRCDGGFVVAEASAAVRRVLELTGLSHLLLGQAGAQPTTVGDQSIQKMST